MATLPTTLSFASSSLKPASWSNRCASSPTIYSSSYGNQSNGRLSTWKLVSLDVLSKRSFPSLRSSSFRVHCAAAKPETVNKVMEIVKKQLVLSDEVALTPETKFSALGADSLDTVEIVMGLEEEFNISVEEDNSQNITTVQEAADLIEKLVQQKAQSS